MGPAPYLAKKVSPIVPVTVSISKPTEPIAELAIMCAKRGRSVPAGYVPCLAKKVSPTAAVTASTPRLTALIAEYVAMPVKTDKSVPMVTAYPHAKKA
jgi:hypothetical protein